MTSTSQFPTQDSLAILNAPHKQFRSLLHALEHSPLLASVDPALIRSHCHVVYGLSKDFSASGLRMGLLYTHNTALHNALSNLSYFNGVGGPLQHQVAELLEDDAWVDMYVEENNRRLRESYAGLHAALERHNIPHVVATSAMFCWLDLSSALPENATWEDERALWREIVYEHGVLMSPGEACYHDKPGFMRMCFAWVPAQALPVAVERIAKCVENRKRSS